MPPIISIASAVLGAGATAYGVNEQKKQAKRAAATQKRMQEKQEADARIALAENAELRDTTGADLTFGTSAADELLKRGSRKKAGAGNAAAGVGVGGL